MKTWKEYINDDTYEMLRGTYEPVEVECPICKNRLYKRTNVVLATNPPQYEYDCIDCGWSGYAMK